jgi:bacillithiol biosynthesis deacetylase BshB1
MSKGKQAIQEAVRVDALAVGAHPDDVELGCGGTLLRLKDLGKSVGVVDLTRGELGTRGDPVIRAREASAAAEILGLKFRVNLEMEDGNVRANQANRLRLVGVIRRCRPQLIMTHAAFGHPDHWQAATLVREAAHHSGLARIETDAERYRPSRIAYWLEFTQTRLPDAVVDISSFWEAKERALKAFESQLFSGSVGDRETYLSHPDFLEQVRSHHVHLGSLSGCAMGEGFLLSRIPRIPDLTEF